MDEILNKLLKSELLSEETKAELTESVEQFKQKVREEVTGEVRSELAEQWIVERDELIDKIDLFVTEALKSELDEFRGDVNRFRDLEVEYAEKLVEAKRELAEEVSTELDELVDKIDAFFEMRLQAEMEELKEDLEIVKQNEFGRKIFEAFVDTFNASHVDEDSIQTRLTVAESKLADARKALAEREEQVNRMVRESKMEQILSPLTGAKREQMAMILKNVETNRLEESYKFFIGRVLKEEVGSTKTTLSEARTTEAKKTTVMTGEAGVVVESQNNDLAYLRRLAGITK